MKYKKGDYVAIHQEPIWRSRANFIFNVMIGKSDGKNEWEQLWWRKIGSHTYMLCCIPFFVHDLNLGDKVETDEANVIHGVVDPSDQVTFRVWFGGQNEEIKSDLVHDIEDMGSLMEWSSENLLALSVPEEGAQRMSDYLQSLELQKLLQYETGRR